MDARNKILAAIAWRACERISRAVIGALQKTTEGMQSGSDSGLKNIWDEICAQVQRQESALWEAHVDTVKDVIA